MQRRYTQCAEDGLRSNCEKDVYRPLHGLPNTSLKLALGEPDVCLVSENTLLPSRRLRRARRYGAMTTTGKHEKSVPRHNYIAGIIQTK